MPDMIDLSRNPAGRRDDYYDVIADGVVVVGRIMLFSATLAKLPWVWTIRGRPLTHHGYAATLEAATQAFARSWHRE